MFGVGIGPLSSGTECTRESGVTQHTDHPFQVVSHGGQPDLGPGSGESAQQQARMAEDAVFERSEGMLDGGASEPHLRRRGSLLHASEDFFMQMSCNQALRRRGAAALQRTAAAGLLGSRVHHASISARELFPLQRFASRTAEGTVIARGDPR